MPDHAGPVAFGVALALAGAGAAVAFMVFAAPAGVPAVQGAPPAASEDDALLEEPDLPLPPPSGTSATSTSALPLPLPQPTLPAP